MQQSDLDMNFEDFVHIYLEDAEHRTREHTSAKSSIKRFQAVKEATLQRRKVASCSRRR